GSTANTRLAVPVLVTVRFSTFGTPSWTLSNARDDVVGLMSDWVPVPFSVTVAGLPAALCGMPSVPISAPAAVGVNVVVSTQLPPGASEVPLSQVLLAARTYCGAE